MDDLLQAFGKLGVSTEVTDLVNSDITSMAEHYITTNQSDTLPTFSPNPICDYGDSAELNQGILQYVNAKGEAALVEKILHLKPNTYIDPLDISTYINYYVSIIEISNTAVPF